MTGLSMLTRRNVLCFFRDRAAVVFSFLTAMIVLVLYFLFLRNVLIDSVYSGDWTVAADGQLPNLMDSWAMAGVVGIVSVTSCAGSLQCMVEDRVTGKSLDFMITPMKTWELAASYVLSSFLVGLVVSAACLAVALAFMCSTGCILAVSDVVVCILLLIPSTLSSAIIMFSLASFIGSLGAFSGFTIVMSTLIGLLYGIYMPMVDLPEVVYIVCNLMPATHMAALFRQSLCSGPLGDVFMPDDASAFRSDMGIDVSLGDFQFDAVSSIVYVSVVTLLFFVVSVAATMCRRTSARWTISRV
ncbi:MAG: ABC transporter permease [Candidatus Methanomethylophilaceae archaeon]|nr:ABC transporter permease [Candidatus Methanomethylophilaceae archaeon]